MFLDVQRRSLAGLASPLDPNNRNGHVEGSLPGALVLEGSLYEDFVMESLAV